LASLRYWIWCRLAIRDGLETARGYAASCTGTVVGRCKTPPCRLCSATLFDSAEQSPENPVSVRKNFAPCVATEYGRIMMLWVRTPVVSGLPRVSMESSVAHVRPCHWFPTAI
jgi:hypothetical protein